MSTKLSDNSYSDTVKRLEKDIAMIDGGAGWASISISLKRIADVLEKYASRDNLR